MNKSTNTKVDELNTIIEKLSKYFCDRGKSNINICTRTAVSENNSIIFNIRIINKITSFTKLSKFKIKILTQMELFPFSCHYGSVVKFRSSIEVFTYCQDESNFVQLSSITAKFVFY